MLGLGPIQQLLHAPWCTQNMSVHLLCKSNSLEMSHKTSSAFALCFMRRSGRAMGRVGSSEAEEDLGGHAALPAGVASLEAKVCEMSPGPCPCPSLAPVLALDAGCSSLPKEVSWEEGPSKKGAVLVFPAHQKCSKPSALVMYPKMSASGMGSGKEKLSPAVSSNELRGEETYRESQTVFSPLPSPAPLFLLQKKKNQLFLETVSACIKGDQLRLCHLSQSDATMRELPPAPRFSICPEMKQVTRA